MQRPNPGTTTLADILITEELSRRVSRAPNLPGENQALRTLIHQMAQDLEALLQSLVDTALELCAAGTTGVSLLETTPDGAEIFRWNALAGTLAHHVGGSTPRNFSPCGVCLDQGVPVLFSHPERYFTYFQEANTPIIEGLVLPLVADSHVFGTIWIMSHDEQRQFDSEDVRLMTSLADFTATALLLQQRQTRELLAANAVLETEIVERKQVEAQTHALIANLPGGAVFVVDRNLRYLLAEGKAFSAAGFKPEDFVGRTIFEALPPELAASYEPMYRQALAGEPFEDEHNAHNHTYISRGTPLRSDGGEIYAVLVVSYDISERKRAEAALRESEEQLGGIVNQMTAGIARTETDGTFTFVNQKYCEMLGCDTGEILGKKKMQDFTHPDDLAHNLNLFWHLAQMGESFEIEKRYIRKDKRIIWVHNSVSALRDAHGNIKQLLAVSVDITDRKQGEDALRKSEAEYRSLFNSMDEGYAVIEVLADDNGEWNDFLYLEVNPAFEQQMGMVNSVGRKATEILGTPNPAWAKIYGQVAETGEPVRFEENETTLDRVFDLYAFRLGEAGSRRVAVLFTDITDRKRREANLAFLADLMNDFAPLATAEEIMEMAGKRIAEHLDLSRYLFVEINPEAGECTHLLPSRPAGQLEISGSYRLADYHTEEENRLLSAGHSMVVNDVRDGTRSPEQMVAFDAFDIASIVNTPYLSNGRWVFDLGVTRSKPSVWREDEIELLREISARVWLRIERARAEADLRQSEAKYRTLFASMDEGFAIAEVIYNPAGQPIDILYLEANPAASRLTGVPEYTQRRISEVLPGFEPYWVELYDRVARTGVSERTEQYTAPLDRWYDFYVFRVEAAEPSGSCRVAVIFQDITDRKRAEETLRENEARQAFLLKLSDILQQFVQPNDIKAAAMRLLGEHLGVSRAQYHECDSSGEYYSADGVGYANGLPLLDLKYRIDDFGTFVNEDFAAGRPYRIDDLEVSLRVSAEERETYRSYQIRAGAGVPLIRGGKLVAILAVHDVRPHHWTDLEMDLIRETAERIWTPLERARAEEALRESEEKYRSLFNSINEGFHIIELIDDEAGEVVDYRFLEGNPAFERLTGLKNTAGKLGSEVAPKTESYWLEAYDQVARTGEPLRIENYSGDTERWYSAYASRVGGAGSRQVAILFDDITERKHAEESLRESEEQQAFLLKFSDALRAEPDADSIASRAVQMLAEYLRLDRFWLSEVFEQQGISTVGPEYHRPDLPPMSGIFRLSDYPETMRQLATQPMVIHDAVNDPAFSDSEKAMLAQLHLRALLVAPLRQGQHQVICALAAAMTTPRHWNESERVLLEQVGERVWAAIERARTEAALRESEAKYRSLFQSIDAGFCVIEVLFDERGKATDYRFLEANPAFEQQTGLVDAIGKTARELASQHEAYWFELYGRIALTGIPERFENAAQDLGRFYDVYAFRIGAAQERKVAVLFNDISARKQAEQELTKTNQLLQATFDNTLQVIQLFKAVRDERGDIADFEWLLTNKQWNDQWGEMAGKRLLRENPAAIETGLFDMFKQVTESGVPITHEHYYAYEQFDGWFFQTIAQVEDGFLLATLDITERKHAEEQLRRAAEMDAFWVKLSDALRSLSDAPEIQRAAMRVLGEHLQVDRVMYAEIDDEETYSIAANYVRGAYPTLIGRFPTSDFGMVSERLRAGETFAIENMTTDERLSEAARAAFIALGVYASVGVPLIKAGRWVANLGIQHGQARQWTNEDIELVQETAERTWAAVERARAEAALRDSEQRLSVIFAQAAVGLSEISLDGHFEQVNDALCQMLGRPRQELLAATVPEVTHPEDVPKSLDALAQLLETGESISLDKRYLRPDGTVLWANSILTRLNGEHGQPHRILAVTLDVGDRKQAEAERLQRMQEQAAREEERQRAEALAELDRAKTAFFSNVSHEFRTPLTLSLAPLQDALSDRTHLLDPVHRERLELIHCNSLRLLKLVNRLLDFSRIEAGRMEAVYEPADLAIFTTELASVFRSVIERAGLRLVVDCPPLPEPVYVDRQMWEKIVLNLLSNAFKFTLEGEITVRLHPADAGYVSLKVQDTGTGIPPEELPHVFERFYQVRRAQARTYEGSGIGLALVHELIQLHGGTIAVSSTMGGGSCFTVTLPLGTTHLPNDRIQASRTLASTDAGVAPYIEEAQLWFAAQGGNLEFSVLNSELEENTSTQTSNLNPQNSLTSSTQNSKLKTQNSLSSNLKPQNSPTSPTSSTSSTQNSKLKTQNSFYILVVDDNADIRDYLKRILGEYVQVEAVADGASVLAAVQARVPALVLSDVMMPGLDGFELLQALRADPRTQQIPIILLSARAGEEAVIEGLAAGADDYLIKPFSAQELVSRVNAHLQMAQLRSEALAHERTINRRKDELLSTVSHELNTPLVAILGWTRLVRANPSNQTMLTKALEIIERNATLQAKLVQDLLDLSRITAGKLCLKLEPVALESVIETAITSVNQMAKAKEINLRWLGVTGEELDIFNPANVEPVLVQGDRERLQQIITNLLTNAIKFTPELGSIQVKLSVIESQNFENSTAEISITDTGIGIATEFLPYVFDRFRQASEADSAKGLGLGLAIARHLVELQGGTIHATSADVGQGTTFTVKLPLLEF